MAAPPPSAARRLLAAEMAAGPLPPLLVAAQRVATASGLGNHGRRRQGRGDDFWQFRPYTPGDSAAMIDWRQTAKGERAAVREREWSSSQTVYLWRSSGSSQAWRSQPTLPDKQNRCDLLLLALAVLLQRGGERLALLSAGAPSLAAARACHHLPQIAERLHRPPTTSDDAELSLPPPLSLPRHASAVLLADFLTPIPETVARLRTLAAEGARGHLLQVLDPAEEGFPFHGRVRFEAPGDAHTALLTSRAEDLRAAYLHRLSHHRAALADAARAVGWTFAVHHTDHPPQQALGTLFHALSLPSAPGGRS